MPKEENHKDGFEGQWWEYPILRNALISGVLAGVGFVLAHVGFISEQVELAFYFVAIPLGGYHWAREAVEELLLAILSHLFVIKLGCCLPQQLRAARDGKYRSQSRN
jgi:hypothetical protein